MLRSLVGSEMCIRDSTIRLYMMFTAPPEQSLEWSDSAIEGASRFLKKFWRLCENRTNTDYQNIPSDFQQSHLDLRAKTHNTIKKVTTDYEDRNSFNTVIAAIMELINAIPEEFKSSEATSTDIFCLNEVINVSLQMLSPIVPHITFDIWTRFNPHLDPKLFEKSWPEFNQKLTEKDETTITNKLEPNKVEEIEDPRAEPGMVIIDVKAAGVSFPDVLIIQGKYQFQPPFPFSPGGEVAGVISEVGEGVTAVSYTHLTLPTKA